MNSNNPCIIPVTGSHTALAMHCHLHDKSERYSCKLGTPGELSNHLCGNLHNSNDTEIAIFIRLSSTRSIPNQHKKFSLRAGGNMPITFSKLNSMLNVSITKHHWLSMSILFCGQLPLSCGHWPMEIATTHQWDIHHEWTERRPSIRWICIPLACDNRKIMGGFSERMIIRMPKWFSDRLESFRCR